MSRDTVAAARHGDRAALEALLDSEYGRIATLSRRLMTDPSDAEDATQETLIAIVRGIEHFDGRSQFSTWVHRVCTNTCLDQLRRRARRPTTVPLPETHDASMSSPEEDPSVRVVDDDTLDRALSGIPDDMRIAVVLRDVVGLDYAEIAEITHAPAGTVRSRIARGRRQVAALLGSTETSSGQAPSGTASPPTTSKLSEGGRQK